jgi:hypothetical protein
MRKGKMKIHTYYTVCSNHAICSKGTSEMPPPTGMPRDAWYMCSWLVPRFRYMTPGKDIGCTYKDGSGIPDGYVMEVPDV